MTQPTPESQHPPVVLGELLTGTWTLLKSNWILLSVLMIETLILLLFKGGQVGLTSDIFLEIALFFFHLAVLGGWLNQIKVVLLDPGHRATWDDFFTGVARYFGHLLAGGAMFLFVCLLGFMMAVSFAGVFAGVPDTKLVEQIGQLVQANKIPELERLATSQSAAMAQLQTWVSVVLAGLALIAIYCATICFWTNWTVLGDQNWIKAWRSSQGTVRRHWKPLTYLGILWLVPTVLLFGTLASGVEILALVGFLLSLIAKTYFTLLFCNFLVKAQPDMVTPLAEAPKPHVPPRL